MSASANIRPNTIEEVRIGTQVWSKRNYDFGGTYPNNDIVNISDYGKLYTWAEAMAIDYPGWHLPTNAEFSTLTSYLGGYLTAGAHLKEVGTTHWTTPNTDADDSSGFSGRGAGMTAGALNEIACFWSSDQSGIYRGAMVLYYNNDNADFGNIVQSDQTASVRLIKD